MIVQDLAVDIQQQYLMSLELHISRKVGANTSCRLLSLSARRELRLGTTTVHLQPEQKTSEPEPESSSQLSVGDEVFIVEITLACLYQYQSHIIPQCRNTSLMFLISSTYIAI